MQAKNVKIRKIPLSHKKQKGWTLNATVFRNFKNTSEFVVNAVRNSPSYCNYLRTLSNTLFMLPKTLNLRTTPLYMRTIYARTHQSHFLMSHGHPPISNLSFRPLLLATPIPNSIIIQCCTYIRTFSFYQALISNSYRPHSHSCLLYVKLRHNSTTT